MNATPPTDQLVRLVEQKLQLLEQLCELSHYQGSLLGGAEINDLVVLLSRKQKLLDGLQSVNEQLLPYQNENPESRLWASQQDRAHCRTTNDRCNLLLQELVELERQAIDTMEAKRDFVANQLQQNDRAQRVHDAYHRQSTEMGTENSLSCNM